jgi:hypothetical protein
MDYTRIPDKRIIMQQEEQENSLPRKLREVNPEQ